MAVSKKRNTTAYRVPRRAGKEQRNPPWFVPVMASMYILGLAWILVYYISGGHAPFEIGNTNLLIGFGFFFVGFLLTTRWQ